MQCKLPPSIGFATRLVFLAFLFFSHLPTQAQDNPIKNEILNYTDTVKDVIAKGRGLLTEKLLAGDLVKVKQIKDYLTEHYANGDHLIFYGAEYSLILYWTQEYNALLGYIDEHDSVSNSSYRYVRPTDDRMLSKLIAKTTESKQQVLSSITAANLNEVEKDFLRLNLEYTLARAEWTTPKRDTLNNLADIFLAKHPKSKYDDYVRTYIRYKLAEPNWGLGCEFFSGYGMFTGNLSKNFTNSVPIGIAFDIQYKRWVLYLRDYIGFSRTKNDIPFSSGVWGMNSQARVFVPEASLGYVVVDNKQFKIAPFAGISSTDIGPTSNDANAQPALKNADIGFSRTYTFGANADIKLGGPKVRKRASYANNYWIVRLRYSFNMPQFELRYPGVTGYYHSVTVGIGSFERRVRRKY